MQKTSNGWEIAAPLSDALTITDALREYSEAMAQLVTGRDGLGRDGTTQAVGSESQPIE